MSDDREPSIGDVLIAIANLAILVGEHTAALRRIEARLDDVAWALLHHLGDHGRAA